MNKKANENPWRVCLLEETFFMEKASFCEDERLVGQMIIGRSRDI